MWLRLPVTRKQEKPPGDEDWNSFADEACPWCYLQGGEHRGHVRSLSPILSLGSVCSEQTGAIVPHCLPGCLQYHLPQCCDAQKRALGRPCWSLTQGYPLHSALNLPDPGFLYL